MQVLPLCASASPTINPSPVTSIAIAIILRIWVPPFGLKAGREAL